MEYYNKFTKWSNEEFVLPSSKQADIIVSNRTPEERHAGLQTLMKEFNQMYSHYSPEKENTHPNANN